MNKLQLRKIILSTSCLVLLIVAVLQTVFLTKDSGKTVKTDKIIDELTIVNASGTIQIVKDNEKWVIGEERYPAIDGEIVSLVDAVSSIQILEKIGNINSYNSAVRYELSDDKAIIVEAKSNGKVVRTLKIGKTSTTNSQTYITIDNNSDIYLVSGNLKNTFDETVDTLRSNIVAEFDVNSISSISIRNIDGNTWSLSRSGEGENVNWSISGVNIEVDPVKAAGWFDSFATVLSNGWYKDDEVASLNGYLDMVAAISSTSGKVSFNIYKIPASSEDEKDEYYGTCSEIPYTFKLADFTVNRFKKDSETLAK